MRRERNQQSPEGGGRGGGKAPVKKMLMALVMCGALCLVPGPALAQKAAPPATKVKEALRSPAREAPQPDPLGRSTPEGTVLGFLKAAQKGELDRAVEYLDTKQSRRRSRELAQQLLVVLDQGVKLNVTTLSRNPEGDVKDGLPLERERIGVVETETGKIDIMLERVQRGEEGPLWLFAAETLRYVPDIYEQVEKPWVEEHIPAPLLKIQILKMPAWRWLAIVIIIVFALFLAWFVGWALRPLLRMIGRRFADESADRSFLELVGPVRTLVLAGAVYACSPLGHSLMARLFWSYVAATLLVVGCTWLCLRIIDIIREISGAWRHPEVASGRIAVIRLAGTLLKALVVITGVVIILYMAGFNLTAVLAGLGVGGIAVAFAAQKTIENLFGGILIVSDRPIRVGDYCRAGDYSGTVVDIGLRSTRLRTMAQTIVSVPNGQLAQMSLENFSVREKILLQHLLRLRPDTTPGQLRTVLQEAEAALKGHPKVEGETARVRFTGFRGYAFEVEVFGYVPGRDFEEFLQVQQDILLQILAVVEASGTGFAVPVTP